MFVDNRHTWLISIIAGACYGLIGIAFALPSPNARVWRLAAWAVSGIVYSCHVVYEQYVFRSRLLATAVHVAIGVAIGGFLLAVGANVHAAMVRSHAPLWRYRVALVAWPIITAVPAFLLTLVATYVLSRVRTNRLAA